jgi:hypothetical protein
VVMESAEAPGRIDPEGKVFQLRQSET